MECVRYDTCPKPSLAADIMESTGHAIRSLSGGSFFLTLFAALLKKRSIGLNPRSGHPLGTHEMLVCWDFCLSFAPHWFQFCAFSRFFFFFSNFEKLCVVKCECDAHTPTIGELGTRDFASC